MKFENAIKLGLLAVCVILAGAACTSTKYSSSSENSESSLSDKGNGDAYNGKSYNFTITSRCADGSDVASTISIGDNSEIVLTRDNCEDLNPGLVLSRDQVNMPDDGITVIYEDRVYTVVDILPPVPQRGLIVCEGVGSTANQIDRFYLKIDLASMTTSAIVTTASSGEFQLYNAPLRDLGPANGGAHEYYTDGDGMRFGYKTIVDLSLPAPVLEDTDFWVANVEFRPVQCVRTP